jgi:hypothetical protein
MRQTLILVGAMLSFCVSAAAQGPAGAGGGGGSVHYSNSNFDLPEWQLALGYQYNRLNLSGKAFSTNGENTSVVRYFGRWFGAEAQVSTGFGNTGTTTSPPNATARTLFAGGGPRLALRGYGRIEPWAHCVVGAEHLRALQALAGPGSNTALAGVGGGGVDYHLNPRISIRVEGDWLVSRFSSKTQGSFQAVTSLVVSF